QPQVVLSVYNGVESLGKRNEAYSGVGRLDNLVTLHGELHGSTSNGILRQFSRFSILALAAVLAPVVAHAAPSYASYNNWCMVGGSPLVTQGLTSSKYVQLSYASCTVTVHVHGAGLAVLYRDGAGTPLANPFTSQTNGYFQFWVDSNNAV